jgi:hypothetical protein
MSAVEEENEDVEKGTTADTACRPICVLTYGPDQVIIVGYKKILNNLIK